MVTSLRIPSRSWGAALLALVSCEAGPGGVDQSPPESADASHAVDSSLPGLPSSMRDAGQQELDARVAPLDAATPDAASSATPGHKTRLMIVGDSITQGSAGDFTWRYRLDRHLTQQGTAFDFVGTRDDVFDNVAERLGSQDYADPQFDRDHDSIWGGSLVEAQTHLQADVLKTGAEIVLLQLGVNDLVFLGNVQQADQNLRSLIGNARLANPNVRFVVGRVLPKRNADDSFVRTAAEFNQRLSTTINELTRADSPIVVATPDVDFDSTTQSYDGVHPNAVGEVHIAAAYADALHAAFGIGAPYPRPLAAVPLGPQTAPVLTVSAMNAAATLRWTASPGATGYYVWVRERGQADGATRLPYAVKSPWTAGQLRNGVPYEFRVQPAKWDAAGVLSAWVAVTPGPL